METFISTYKSENIHAFNMVQFYLLNLLNEKLGRNNSRKARHKHNVDSFYPVIYSDISAMIPFFTAFFICKLLAYWV